MAGQNLGDDVRPDSPIRPLTPPLEKLTSVLFHQPPDRALVHEQNGSQLLEEPIVDVADFLEPNDLVGSTDDASVAQEPGDLAGA